MFSVYGIQGRLFRGSLEQLRKVGGVDALTRSRAVQPIGREGRDKALEDAGAFATTLANSARPEGTPSAAMAAYAPAQPPRQPLRAVRSLMSTPVIRLPSSATVQQAWQTLADQHVGQAPVVDEKNQLVGMLLRADLLKPERLPAPDAPASAWHAMLLQNVADLMVTPVPSVVADADIRRVARVLLDTALPGLPVVDDTGDVLGFISRSDILRAVVTDPPLDLWG